MTTEDHNKTVVVLYAALALFFAFGLGAAPWIIAKNFREQPGAAALIFGTVFLMLLLFASTAVAVYRRSRAGRALALMSSVAALPILWPIGVYTWWFMHSDGAKRLYGVKSGRALDPRHPT